jgi:two-component system response regulator AgrA
MLKVFICDDNNLDLKKTKQLIKEIIVKNDLDLSIALCTNSSDAILEHIIENKYEVGIYILDINFRKDFNGIKLAEKIREIDPTGFIIFLTNHPEMSFFVFKYQVEALDYIIKGDTKEIMSRLHSSILKACRTYKNSNSINEVLTIKNKDRIINVKFDDILFIETSSNIHKLILHHTNGHIEFLGSLKNLQSTLPKNFFRCHNSFIINKSKVKEINKLHRTISFINGEICSASLRRINHILSPFI